MARLYARPAPGVQRRGRSGDAAAGDAVVAGCRAAMQTRTHWLKALGHAGGAMADAWLEDGRPGRLRRTGFPRPPRMVPGDRLVYYAAGWRAVFAVVEVVGEPTDEHPSRADPARWPWSVEVEPLLLVARLSAAPPVEAA